MEKDIIAFTRGVPPAESFPREALITCAENVMRKDGATILQYGSGAGYAPLRDHLANQHQVSAERLLAGQGSLQLLDHLCRARLTRGDRVFIEQPTYDRTITLLNRAGAELVGFHLRDGQIDMDEVKKTLASGNVPRFFYVIPDFQNPSGATMSLENRHELVNLSQRFGFTIIEDSPYRHLRYEGDPFATLFSLAPDRVVYMSSFSKIISPGLRTGYMILNHGMARDMIRFATDTYVSPSMLDQAIVLEFLNMGLLDDHIRDLKHLFYPRLRALLAALENHLADLGYWTKPQGGYFVGLFLKEEVSFPAEKHAAEQGLALSNGAGFFINSNTHFLRLPFCALSESSIQEGVRRLRTLLEK